MKTKTFIISIILYAFFVQINYGQDTLKATSKQFMTELNVNLFQGQLSLNNVLNQIKLRYLVSENKAIRIGFTIDSKKEIQKAETTYGTSPSKNDNERTTTTIGINFGSEKRFTGTKRLSPYIGYEVSLGKKWSKQTTETSNSSIEIKGAWTSTSSAYSSGYYTTTTSYLERAFFSYGLNFVTGFDFYMAKNLFIGYEIEFGLTKTNYQNIDVTTSGSTSSTSNYPDRNDSDFTIGPRVINGIRIGYVF